MVSVFLIAAVAAASAPASAGPAGDPAQLDRQCFRLMAGLAESEDPATRRLGLVAAQYFLGRIDARGGAAADAGGPIPPGAQAGLVRACGDAMGESGRDFQTIGNRLAFPGRPTA